MWSIKSSYITSLITSLTSSYGVGLWNKQTHGPSHPPRSYSLILADCRLLPRWHFHVFVTPSSRISHHRRVATTWVETWEFTHLSTTDPWLSPTYMLREWCFGVSENSSCSWGSLQHRRAWFQTDWGDYEAELFQTVLSNRVGFSTSRLEHSGTNVGYCSVCLYSSCSVK